MKATCYINGVAITKDDFICPAIGTDVIYYSDSGKKYQATITGIPINPWHGYSKYPTVSLSFRDMQGHVVRKERVVPFQDLRSMCYEMPTKVSYMK